MLHARTNLNNIVNNVFCVGDLRVKLAWLSYITATTREQYSDVPRILWMIFQNPNYGIVSLLHCLFGKISAVNNCQCSEALVVCVRCLLIVNCDYHDFGVRKFRWAVCYQDSV